MIHLVRFNTLIFLLHSSPVCKIIVIVPPPPTNFNITRAHRTLLNATVTYEWDPPQSGVRGQEVIDSFEIVFVPSPLSHPSSNIINSSIWKFNVTLDINVLYNVTIASMNCVGSGRSVALNNIVISECTILDSWYDGMIKFTYLKSCECAVY